MAGDKNDRVSPKQLIGKTSLVGRLGVLALQALRPNKERGLMARAARIAIGAWAISFAIVCTATVVGIVAVVGGEASGASSACGVSGKGKAEIPVKLIPIYQHASEQYKLGDRGVSILAGINKIETDFGRNLNTSSAGAQGWMQFMPGTWAAYGVDANKDGRKDPNDPEDAIHAAANYLRASGAPKDWRKAIFAYNHADWYVAQVLEYANGFQGECEQVEGEGQVDIGNIDFNDTSGAWGGAQKFAEAAKKVAKQFGCTPFSEKRPRMLTASGGVSDHWQGAKHSYAVDLDNANCSMTYPGGDADKTAKALAKAFGFAQHTGLMTIARGKYRLQLIWQASGHYDHVHFGARNTAFAN